MSRFILSVLGILLLFAILLGVYTLRNTSKNMPEEAVSQSTDFASWHFYTSPDEKFRVFFPSIPQSASQGVAEPTGQKKRHLTAFISEKEDGATYLINIITLPEALPAEREDAVLKDVVNEMVSANSNNKLKNMTSSDFHKMKAVDFTIENSDMKMKGKAFLSGREIFVLRVANKPDVDPQGYAFFINSFELVRAK